MSGGVLVASKVKFGDTIRIEANATATGPLVALGRTIYTTAGTEIVNGPIWERWSQDPRIPEW